MSRRKVSPEAQIIALFTGLSEEGKDKVRFALEAIASIESPKSSAPVAAPRSSPRRAATKSTLNTETKTDGATTAGPKCVAQVPNLDVPCGEPRASLIHNPNGGYASYHEFEAIKSKRAAK